MTFDSREFRTALGRFATGVVVVTGLDSAGGKVGVTINAFSSVSLEPPLILFCLGRNASCFDVFTTRDRFAVNVLAEEQQPVSNTFAGRGPDKFAAIAHGPGDNGCPLIDGCLAHLECDREAIFEGGDHAIIVGRVTRLSVQEGGWPLLYFGGRYNRVGDKGA